MLKRIKRVDRRERVETPETEKVVVENGVISEGSIFSTKL